MAAKLVDFSTRIPEDILRAMKALSKDTGVKVYILVSRFLADGLANNKLSQGK